MKTCRRIACWTGVEYAISSMLIDFGMVRQGLDVARAVHDRYLRAGSCWNHNECGSHYYRAMSSWATLLAATGFKPDAPRHTLTIAPAGEPGRAARALGAFDRLGPVRGGPRIGSNCAATAGR